MTLRILIPSALLEALDRKARALKISRDQLILRAIEKEVAPCPGADWPPGFFERLSRVEPDVAEAVDETLLAAREARSSKPPQLF